MLLLSRLLRRLVRRGTLRVTGPDGAQMVFGDGGEPRAAIRIADHATARRLALDPQLAVGEAYMDGRLIVDGDLFEFLKVAFVNLADDRVNPLPVWIEALRRMTRRIQQYNPVSRARRNVAHHYDLTGELYQLFLDSDRQYSCAYFGQPDDALETAQERKKRHIAAKLLLRPGQRVLDIGSGWGGLALYLAEIADVEVTGLTLSQEQFKAASERAARRGLEHRVRFRLQDYREETGRYDRIVSVGMFEHVGVGHYEEYFRQVRNLLEDDGVALLHTIGRADGPGATNAWIRKYIFPGGYSPALSEIMPAIERSRLYATDIEILRLHYAETLKAWRQRFHGNRSRIAELFDDRFCRMWDFYLAASEATFRWAGHVNFQIQLARRLDTVPLVRDYMFDGERAIAGPTRRAARPPSMVAD